jgi:hypothetical protein
LAALGFSENSADFTAPGSSINAIKIANTLFLSFKATPLF